MDVEQSVWWFSLIGGLVIGLLIGLYMSVIVAPKKKMYEQKL